MLMEHLVCPILRTTKFHWVLVVQQMLVGIMLGKLQILQVFSIGLVQRVFIETPDMIMVCFIRGIEERVVLLERMLKPMMPILMRHVQVRFIKTYHV